MKPLGLDKNKARAALNSLKNGSVRPNNHRKSERSQSSAGMSDGSGRMNFVDSNQAPSNMLSAAQMNYMQQMEQQAQEHAKALQQQKL